MNLYKVTLQGMKHSTTGAPYGINYVVAPDPTTAFNIVKNFLDESDIGFATERQLESIELIAESSLYGFPYRLFICSD